MMSAGRATICVVSALLIIPLFVLLLSSVLHDYWGTTKSHHGHDHAAWQQGDLYLEDFSSMSINRIQPQIEVLDFSVSLADEHEDDYDELRLFYRKCARNLKRAAPRLRFVSYNGGYIFNPLANAVCWRNSTPASYRVGKLVQTLTRELTTVSHHLRFIDQLSTHFGWKINNFDFNMIMVFEPEVVRAANYSQLVLDLFNHTVSAEEEARSEAKFTFQSDNTPINVRLSFSNDEMFRNNEQERTKFFLAHTRRSIPTAGRIAQIAKKK